MNGTGKIDSFEFEVAPFDDDFTGRLSWGVLGKRVLPCAEKHAGARGFARLEKDGRQYLWVLSRMVFEIDKWPRRGDKYTVSTWVRRYYRYFTDRCFDLRDAEGNVIGRVFTIWAMIDAETRKPQLLEDLFGHTFDRYLETERPCEVQPFTRVRIAEEHPAYTRKAYYSDIDENNHVNSIHYIQFILDAFPKEQFAAQEVSRLEIAYNSESLYGDELAIYKEAVDDWSHHVVVKKRVGDAYTETVCHCVLTFRNAEQ